MADQSTTVKSGWKTTELYLGLVGLSVLAWAIYDLGQLLPSIVKSLSEGSNPILASVFGLATTGLMAGLGWLSKQIVAHYMSVRLQLKLGDFLPLPPGDVQPVPPAQPDPGNVAASQSAGADAAKSPTNTL